MIVTDPSAAAGDIPTAARTTRASAVDPRPHQRGRPRRRTGPARRGPRRAGQGSREPDLDAGPPGDQAGAGRGHEKGKLAGKGAGHAGRRGRRRPARPRRADRVPDHRARQRPAAVAGRADRDRAVARRRRRARASRARRRMQSGDAARTPDR